MYKVLCRIEASPSGRNARKARCAVWGERGKQMRRCSDSIRLGRPILGDLLLRRANRRVVDLNKSAVLAPTSRRIRMPIQTLVAKRSEHSDSLRCVASGERLRNMRVFEFPLSEFCSK